VSISLNNLTTDLIAQHTDTCYADVAIPDELLIDPQDPENEMAFETLALFADFASQEGVVEKDSSGNSYGPDRIIEDAIDLLQKS